MSCSLSLSKAKSLTWILSFLVCQNLLLQDPPKPEPRPEDYPQPQIQEITEPPVEEPKAPPLTPEEVDKIDPNEFWKKGPFAPHPPRQRPQA